jgi:hypothetical protein
MISFQLCWTENTSTHGSSQLTRTRSQLRDSWSSARAWCVVARAGRPLTALCRPSRSTTWALDRTWWFSCPTPSETTCNIVFFSFAVIFLQTVNSRPQFGTYNYRTKYLSDEWMTTRGFMEPSVSAKDPWWVSKSISDIKEVVKVTDSLLEDVSISCTSALQLMKSKSVESLFYFKDGYGLQAKIQFFNIFF